MKFNKAQLHQLFCALTDGIEWQDSLAASYVNFLGEVHKSNKRWYDAARNASLRYSNVREQIGHVLRGEAKS